MDLKTAIESVLSGGARRLDIAVELGGENHPVQVYRLHDRVVRIDVVQVPRAGSPAKQPAAKPARKAAK